jgi:hypothetical protein
MNTARFAGRYTRLEVINDRDAPAGRPGSTHTTMSGNRTRARRATRGLPAFQAPTLPRLLGRNHWLDVPRVIAVTLLVGTLLTVTSGVAVSDAHQMTVFSCHDPAGNPVGHDGWLTQRTGDLNMSLIDNCSSGAAGALALELGASTSGYGGGARSEWVFSAPTWSTISGYELQIAGSYAIPSTGAGSGQVYVNASDESDPNYDYRNLGAGAVGAYTLSRTPPAPVSSIDVNASCDGQYGPCAGGAVISRVEVSSAAFLLNDSTTPAVGGLTGSLVSGSTLKGTAEVSFAATDSGPGVYSAWLVVDGQSQPAAILNTNNGWCRDLGQTTNGTRSFAHPDPCPQSASGTLALDTTGLADGAHSLKLVVDDASGDTTTAYSGSFTTANSAGRSAAFASAAPVGSGTANGAGASESARVLLNGRHTIARSFAHRAFKLGGGLLDSQGRPIANAELDVLERTGSSGQTRAIAHVRTGADGSFAAGVPAGPSRIVTIRYRAFSGDPSYSAQASVAESVAAGVRLRVSPGHTSSNGTITLSGQVLGPLPRQGVVVELLVHYRGVWEPFRTPRTDSRGRFSVAYRFQGGVGTFPFRAEVLGGQSGFPYAQGSSGAVDVATR